MYTCIILDHPHSHPSSILHTLSIAIYTERQNKFITSSVWRSLKSTASKLIIYLDTDELKNLIRTSEKKSCCCQKGEKYGEIANGNFVLKFAETTLRASSTETAYSEHSIAIHLISMAGCVTALPAFHSPSPGSEQFLWFFEEWPLVISPNFIYFVLK